MYDVKKETMDDAEEGKQSFRNEFRKDDVYEVRKESMKNETMLNRE